MLARLWVPLVALVYLATPLAAQDATAVLRAAEAQVGVVTIYDPAYVDMPFPNGDVPPDRGVCTDVVIRALRAGAGLDLQALINADMRAHFAAYPRNWGLSRPDSNIDHRRVPNMQAYFTRLGAAVDGPYVAGDIVTVMLPRNLPHVVIVSDKMGASGPLIVHNIGAGTQIEDRLAAFKVTGHFRLGADILAKMAAAP